MAQRFVSDANLVDLADEINQNMVGYKLDTENRLTHFFAQVRTEVGRFLRLTESLDYASQALRKFSYFRAHPAEADIYGRNWQHAANQQEIANRIYNGINGVTSLGNGNIESGDGWRYRGRGLKQLTGKHNYKQFNSAYPSIWPGKNIDFLRNPDLLGEIKYGVRSAVFFWIQGKLYEIADLTDATNSDRQVDKITEIINEHTDSYGERRQHFHEIMNQRIFREIQK